MIPPARDRSGRTGTAIPAKAPLKPVKNSKSFAASKQFQPPKAAAAATSVAAPANRAPPAGSSITPAFERLLTVDDVIEITQISLRQVRRMIASGELPVVRFGKLVRIRPSDLAARLQGE